jgi:putative transposase
MARKRFTPEQIVAILREAERGADRKALYRKHGMCEQTFYRWKRMYGGLGVPEIKRIKQLEEENRKLKEMVGEQAMVIQAQKDVMKKKGWA